MKNNRKINVNTWTWLTATAEMDADCRGWYFNLLLYDCYFGSIPNDIKELGEIAVVKASEYGRFKQVLKDLLKQKFKQAESGRLTKISNDGIIWH